MPGPEIEVWTVPLDRPRAGLRRLVELLDENERQRASAFYRERDRLRFTVSHAALRCILADRLNADPASLAFATNHSGKPVLACGGLHFSLSHSERLALVAVSHDRPVGVDVEWMRDRDTRSIADRFFAVPESAGIEAAHPADRLRQFYALWTCKESCLKEDGRGISSGLASVRVEIRRDGELFAHDESGVWATAVFEPMPGYLGAVAARGEAAYLRSRRWAPSLNEHWA